MKKLELDKELIKNLYLKGYSCAYISKQIGCSERPVQLVLKELNIMRSWSEATSTRKYRTKSIFNENYFENIDNQEKAYWLGFLMADGYISKDLKRVVLALAETEPLEKFLKCIESNQNFKKYTSKDGHVYYSLHVTSSKMVQDLISWGCFNKKTYTLKFPNLSSNLIPHFIRGYFDGDGSIYFNKPIGNYIRPTVAIVGNEDFLIEMKKHLAFLNRKLALSIRHKERNNNIRYFRFDGKRTCKLFEKYIYSDASIYLERKKQKFKDI